MTGPNQDDPGDPQSSLGAPDRVDAAQPSQGTNDLVSSLGVSTCATLSCLGLCEVAGVVPVDGRVAPAGPRCKQDSSRFLQWRCHLQAAAGIAAAFAKPKTSERYSPSMHQARGSPRTI